MPEIELKFGLTEAAAGAVDAALRERGATAEEIESRYWDSADRRLARAALSLRLRHTRGAWEQTVKAAGPSPAERLEETVARPGDWSEVAPAPELWLHAGSDAGALLDEALARRGGKLAPLELVHTTRICRCALDVDAGGAGLEVVLDRGTVEAGERSQPLCEVEVELKDGDARALIELARANVDAHGMWLSTTSKAMRGGRLAAGPQAPRGVKSRPARLERNASGPRIFRAVLRSCLDQVLANASLVADGDGDAEVVHQLRVGIRRLRTARRELGGWRGALGDGWQVAVAEVFRKLGELRDRDTVAAAMQQRLVAAGSPEPALGQGGAADGADPITTVRDPAFQHALLDLLAFLLAPDDAWSGPPSRLPERAGGDGEVVAPPPPSPQPSTASGRGGLEFVSRRLERLHRRLQRDAKRFEQLDDSARHTVRKRLKRLRYLSELVAPMFKRGRVERFLNALEPAQDELGRYVDLLVATRLAREVVDGGDARGWFNVGWLQAQIPRAIERCGKCLGRVTGAEPFWR